jgi:hypothetical protein
MKKILVFMALFFGVPLFAQTGTVQGWCNLGGNKATTQGAQSTNYLQGVIPSCTVTVYLTGTTTKATIYSNNLSTPLANPFTANAVGAVNPGGWLFWGATGAGLDVCTSGGIAPNTFPSPVCLTNVFPSSAPGGGGGGGVGAIFPGTNVTCSPNVAGSCTGSVTINSSGGGGGSSYGAIDPTASILWSGTSIIYDDNTTQSPHVAITSWSTSGSTTTFTTATHHLIAGDWVTVSSATGWPLAGHYGTGHGIFQVLSAGLTATQFEINVGALSPGNCASTCGFIQSSMNNMPFVSVKKPSLPPNLINNTVAVIEPSNTIVNMNTNYTTLYHSYSPAVTGHPGYFVIIDYWNDIELCESVATIEAAYQGLLPQLHTDGWIVILPSVPVPTNGTQFGSGFCSFPASPYGEAWQLQNYLQGLGPSTYHNQAQGGDGIYWDLMPDAGLAYNDPTGNMAYGQSSAWQLFTNAIYNAMYTGSTVPLQRVPIYFGQTGVNGTGLSANNNGWVFAPGRNSSSGTWCFANALVDRCILRMDTSPSGSSESMLTDGYLTVSGANGNNTSLTVTNTSSSSNADDIAIIHSAISTSNDVKFGFGHDNTNYNIARLGFQYNGASSTSNLVYLRIPGATEDAFHYIPGTFCFGMASGTTNCSGAPLSIDEATGKINSTTIPTSATLTQTIASGTAAMGTGAITSGTCATVVTVAATGTATTDVIVYTPNADPTAVTGYAVSASGSLYIWAYPTANNVNFKVCNNTAGSLTPSALTLNWRVTR